MTKLEEMLRAASEAQAKKVGAEWRRLITEATESQPRSEDGTLASAAAPAGCPANEKEEGDADDLFRAGDSTMGESG
jgi:hypothetical protein